MKIEIDERVLKQILIWSGIPVIIPFAALLVVAIFTFMPTAFIAPMIWLIALGVNIFLVYNEYAGADSLSKKRKRSEAAGGLIGLLWIITSAIIIIIPLASGVSLLNNPVPAP